MRGGGPNISAKDLAWVFFLISFSRAATSLDCNTKLYRIADGETKSGFVLRPSRSNPPSPPPPPSLYPPPPPPPRRPRPLSLYPSQPRRPEHAMPSPLPRLVGINHVALEVGDIEEALAFYGKTR